MNIALWIILCLDKNAEGLNEFYFQNQNFYQEKEIEQILKSFLKSNIIRRNEKEDFVLIKGDKDLNVGDIIACLYSYEWLDSYIEGEDEETPFLKRDFVMQCYEGFVHELVTSFKDIPVKIYNTSNIL